MKIEFHRIPYSLPNEPPENIVDDQRLISLDQSLPDKMATLAGLRSCQYTMDLTLHRDHLKWGKSLAAQRCFFINVARELISTECLKIRNIYMIFEVQVNTAQLHCHSNIEFADNLYTEHTIVLIKRALHRVYNIKPVGMYVCSIKNVFDRTDYLLKVKTKVPGFLVRFERCAADGGAFATGREKR